MIDWHLGHLTLAGVKSLIPGYPVPCGTLEYWASHPHCDVQRAGRAAREQGALVSLAHFENLPGAETPVAVALGLLDALEIPTWSDPMQLPAHLSPWDDVGDADRRVHSHAGRGPLLPVPERRLPAAIGAGTDKSGEDIPVGSNRVYAQTKGSAGFAAWLAGIKAGAGFVTNGPLLEFDVDGHGTGEVVAFQGAKTVKVHAIGALDPAVHDHRDRDERPPGGAQAAPWCSPTRRSMGSTCWRRRPRCASRRAAGSRLARLPTPTSRRGSCRASRPSSRTRTPSTTSRTGRKVREEASIAYLRKSVKGLLHWLSTRPKFASEADRAAVERDAEKALRFYEAQ